MTSGDFLDIQFPEDISYGSAGGPTFFTDIHTTHGGYEHRNINWEEARAQYRIAYSMQNEEQLSSLISFFHICRGRAYGFRFRDWTDYKVEDHQMQRCSSDGSIYHMVKWYAHGSTSVVRRIFKPREGSVTVSVDGGSSKSFNEHEYTIDYNRGLIVFSDELQENSVVTATFLFDVPVRFDADFMPVSLEGNSVYGANGVQMIELRYLDECKTEGGVHVR